MRLTDLVLCFPPIILALAIAAALGIGTTNTIIAMLVVWWPKFARLARSLVIVQRSQEYVEAAVVIGLQPGAHPAAPHHPERGRAADRARDARRRQRHHHLRRAVLPRPRRRAADAGMGLDGGRGPRADRAMVGRGLSRPRHPDRRARLQLPRRRHPRLARPEIDGAGERRREAGARRAVAHARPRGPRPARPSSSPTRAWCARSTASASRSRPARRSASSANRARARASPRSR